jgi:hypothetical protein
MNDMSKVIVAKSDQLNSDDLVGGPITITIRDVKISGTEQPVSIFYEGDNGKPYKPCKSMARVMVAAWQADANKYIGRSMTLYRDPKVKWAGMEVGGIRISHMSHIDHPMTLVLNETKGKKAAVQIKPLKNAPASNPAASKPADVPAVDVSKPAALIQVPQLADNSGADWRAWLKLIGAVIDVAPNADWLNGLVAENQAPIGGLRDASEKQYSALMTKIEARNKALSGEIPFDA